MGSFYFRCIIIIYVNTKFSNFKRVILFVSSKYVWPGAHFTQRQRTPVLRSISIDTSFLCRALGNTTKKKAYRPAILYPCFRVNIQTEMIRFVEKHGKMRQWSFQKYFCNFISFITLSTRFRLVIHISVGYI